MTPRRVACLAGLACAALVLATCGSGVVSEAPSASCSEVGARCQLPEGPLGICERAPCPAGEDEPCFRCTPQH